MCQACDELPVQINDVVEISQINEPEISETYHLKPGYRGIVLRHNEYYMHIPAYWTFDKSKMPEDFEMNDAMLTSDTKYQEDVKKYLDMSHKVIVWQNNEATSATILVSDRYIRFSVCGNKVPLLK